MRKPRYLMEWRGAVCRVKWSSDEGDAGGATFGAHGVGPDAGLGLADVGFVEKDHAEATLTDAAADAEGQLAAEEALVEEELLAVFLALEGQLAFQSFLIDAYAHG